MNLKVEDTGIGISRQDRKKLFSAFSQVDEALNRNYQGTGLGLVISQELIKLMHGQLALTSVSGQGSCFSISLKMNQLTNRYYLSPSTEWRDKKVVIYDIVFCNWLSLNHASENDGRDACIGPCITR